MVASRVFVLSVLIVLGAFMLPFFTHAQNAADEMRAAIRASLSRDPNTTKMTPEEYANLVNALTAEAQKQGIPPSTLVPPAVSQEEALPIPDAEPVCVTSPAVCSFAAFMHLTEMHAIWLMLGVVAGLMAIVVGVMLGHHKKTERALSA